MSVRWGALCITHAQQRAQGARVQLDARCMHEPPAAGPAESDQQLDADDCRVALPTHAAWLCRLHAALQTPTLRPPCSLQTQSFATVSCARWLLWLQKRQGARNGIRTALLNAACCCAAHIRPACIALRQVFGIVGVQLLITVGVACACLFVPAIKVRSTPCETTLFSPNSRAS